MYIIKLMHPNVTSRWSHQAVDWLNYASHEFAQLDRLNSRPWHLSLVQRTMGRSSRRSWIFGRLHGLIEKQWGPTHSMDNFYLAASRIRFDIDIKLISFDLRHLGGIWEASEMPPRCKDSSNSSEISCPSWTWSRTWTFWPVFFKKSDFSLVKPNIFKKKSFQMVKISCPSWTWSRTWVFWPFLVEKHSFY